MVCNCAGVYFYFFLGPLFRMFPFNKELKGFLFFLTSLMEPPKCTLSRNLHFFPFFCTKGACAGIAGQVFDGKLLLLSVPLVTLWNCCCSPFSGCGNSQWKWFRCWGNLGCVSCQTFAGLQGKLFLLLFNSFSTGKGIRTNPELKQGGFAEHPTDRRSFWLLPWLWSCCLREGPKISSCHLNRI